MAFLGMRPRLNCTNSWPRDRRYDKSNWDQFTKREEIGLQVQIRAVVTLYKPNLSTDVDAIFRKR